MNELIPIENRLPDTMRELARFVLVGREKYNAVRAEIRAIEKLELAQEVREQKRMEAKMIAEAVIDAEIRLGELFKEIPTKQGRRTDIELSDSAVAKCDKSKTEIIKNLGFTKRQSERLETLAENKDLVEYVKNEARENDGFPSRTRVLDLVTYQNRQEDELCEYDNFMDLRAQVYKELMKIIELTAQFEISDDRMEALRDNFDHMLRMEDHINYINETTDKLNKIKSEIRRGQSYDKKHQKKRQKQSKQ